MGEAFSEFRDICPELRVAITLPAAGRNSFLLAGTKAAAEGEARMPILVPAALLV